MLNLSWVQQKDTPILLGHMSIAPEIVGNEKKIIWDSKGYKSTEPDDIEV